MERFIVILVTDWATDPMTVDIANNLTSIIQQSTCDSNSGEAEQSYLSLKEGISILERHRGHYISVVQQKFSEDLENTDPEWEKVQESNDHSQRPNLPKCLQRLKERLAATGENNTLRDSKVFADKLHLLADKLPMTGSYLLDVVWLTSGETDLPVQEHLHLFGCLRRLLEWHHANITFLSGKDLTQNKTKSWNPWLVHLSASYVLIDSEDPQHSLQLLYLQPNVLWKGWMTLTESWGVSSLALPGFVLTKWKEDNLGAPVEKFKVIFNKEKNKKRSVQPQMCLIGARNLDVVQIVKVEEMPVYLISPVKYKLSLAPTQGAIFNRSKKFLSWLSESQNDVGALVRLECKFCDSEANLGRRHQCSTSHWKDAVMKNPSNIAAPDVSVKGTIHNLQFLLHGINDRTCTAYLLQSPDQLNGHVGHRLAWYENTLTIVESDSKTTAEGFLEDLPLFELTDLQKMETEVQALQAVALQQWIEKRQQENLGFQITHSELINLLETAKRHYMKSIQKMERKYKVKDMKKVPIDVNYIPSELDVSPSEWPERQALVNQESISKKLKRINTEDMIFRGEVIKAPQQDDSVRLDVREFLKYFKSSGEAVNSDLSPVGVSDSNSGKGMANKPSMSSITSEELKKAEFKEAKRLSYHGINYCLESRNSEQMTERLNNLQSRYITHETSSTCTLDQASSPATMAMLAPSPATASSPKDDDAQCPIKSSGESTSSVPGTPTSQKRKRKTTPKGHTAPKRPIRSSPRRASIPRIAALKKEVSGPGKSSGQRSHERAASVGSASAGSKVESRSERHKRKLRHIVDINLMKQGISKDHECYQQCATRLYTLSKSFLKDLKTSHGLEQEMRSVVESNVEQVVKFEIRRVCKL